MFASPPRDVEQNILLAKLRPGQVGALLRWTVCIAPIAVL
jgi:hypothetical protein